MRSSIPRIRVSLVAALTVGLLQGCAAGPADESAPPGPAPVVIQPGPTSEDQEERAARLFQQALQDFDWGRMDDVMEEAGTVVEELPTTRVSGAALWLLARAQERAGRNEAALASARRYADLLAPDDPRRAPAHLLEGRILTEEGRAGEAAAVMLSMPGDMPAEIRDEALTLVRDLAPALETEQLGDLLAGTPLGQPLAAPLMVAYARALRLAGEPSRAREYAEASLQAGATGPDADAARALLADLGAGPEGAVAGGVRVRIAALLPSSGSPSLQRYANLIEEGVRAALEAPDVPPNVTLEVADDGGDPIQAADRIRALESEPVVAVVGPLLDDELMSAARARTGPLPLISPTALTAEGGAGIFSLGAPDPGAARALARYAAGSGLDYVVVIHPDQPESNYEARVFRETLEEQRGSVLRTITYPPGTTTFGDALRQAEALHPDALFLPVPAEDIQALAPQVSFFGLDTLGVNILGTADWASDEVLQSVSPRHTDGVVTATPRQPGPQSEAYQRFVRAYEERFQRSVRDPLPAAGYDAASLLLLAVRSGAGTPAEVRRALERIQGFEGATGVLSVEDGRVVREHHLVCIQDRALLDVEPGEATIHYRPMRPGDPEKNEPERVPAGPLEIYCPGTAPPELSGRIR